MNGRMLHGDDTFTFQTDSGTGLGTVPDLAHNGAVQGTHRYLAAAYRGGERNVDSGLHIYAVSGEAGLAGHMYLQQQIACSAGTDTRVALAFQADALAIVDACGNVYLQGLSAGLWIV